MYRSLLPPAAHSPVAHAASTSPPFSLNVPALRTENACASGSAAVHVGLTHLLAGRASNVLVVGAEKMTGIPAETVGAALLGADYDAAGTTSSTGFAGLFAEVARAYEDRYGPVADTLGAIAAIPVILDYVYLGAASEWLISIGRWPLRDGTG